MGVLNERGEGPPNFEPIIVGFPYTKGPNEVPLISTPPQVIKGSLEARRIGDFLLQARLLKGPTGSAHNYDSHVRTSPAGVKLGGGGVSSS